MTKLSSPYLRRLMQILGLAAGLGVCGWSLTLFSAPAPVWVGTALVVGYLLWVGRGGIFLASLWITALISLAIALDIFPAFWPHQLHYRYWALTVILLWGFGTLLLAGLGRYAQSLRSGLAPAAPRQRTGADYLAYINPAIQESLTPEQQTEIERVIDLALPRPAPKLVDLRFDIDLITSRFFIVLFVGKDRRQADRHHRVSRLTTVGNWLAAIVLLIGVNLAISIGVLLLAYLVKSALGINLFPGHFRGFIK